MSGIFDSYLSGGAGAFFPGHYAAAEDRRRAVLAAIRPLASSVADVMAAQNARLAPSPARDAHLAALRDGAAAVVTGQQVGLFLGPLFTLYKAASAICAARALASETGRPVVPVFWLQTEDHDLPEIAVCHAPRGGGDVLTLELPATADERVSLAHRFLPEGVAACLQQLRAEIGHLPHAEAHLSRLGSYYRPGVGWVSAFAGLLAELFAEEGLVLIDGRDPAFATDAAPIHRRALAAAGAIHDALAERVRALEAAGFAGTVHLRPGAPLSFFHPDGASGPRYRLEPTQRGFAEVGGRGVHSLEALLAAVAAEPMRFSTSALLRPILQDTLLPTAAYVAGPGEVAYFAQLAPLYAAYDLRMPLVVPRARLRLVEEKARRLLDRLGVGAADAARPEDELLAMARGGGDGDDVTGLLLTPFDAALAELRRRSEALGPSLEVAIDKTRAAVEHAVGKLAERIEKARLRSDSERVVDVVRLKRLLHPQGMPQERFYGMSYFAARYGEREVVARVLSAIDPFDAQVRDIELHERVSAPGSSSGATVAGAPSARREGAS